MFRDRKYASKTKIWSMSFSFCHHPPRKQYTFRLNSLTINLDPCEMATSINLQNVRPVGWKRHLTRTRTRTAKTQACTEHPPQSKVHWPRSLDAIPIPFQGTEGFNIPHLGKPKKHHRTVQVGGLAIGMGYVIGGCQEGICISCFLLLLVVPTFGMPA